MLLACCKPCRPAGLFLWPLRWRTPGVRLQSPLPGKLIFERARVAELADAPDLGSGGETRGGSSPPFRTNYLADFKILTSALFPCAQIVPDFLLHSFGRFILDTRM